jgi:hypothetical protein
VEAVDGKLSIVDADEWRAELAERLVGGISIVVRFESQNGQSDWPPCSTTKRDSRSRVWAKLCRARFSSCAQHTVLSSLLSDRG